MKINYSFKQKFKELKCSPQFSPFIDSVGDKGKIVEPNRMTILKQYIVYDFSAF